MRLTNKAAAVALALLLLGADAGLALAQSPGDLATSDRGATAYMSDSYYWQTHTPLGPALLT